jgi:hypothetical protein
MWLLPQLPTPYGDGSLDGKDHEEIDGIHPEGKTQNLKKRVNKEKTKKMS